MEDLERGKRKQLRLNNVFDGTTKGKTRVLKDFRSFKKKLHRLIDKTKLEFEGGEKWGINCKYFFILDNALVDVVTEASSNPLDEVVQETVNELHKAIKNQSKENSE
jgi:hypothetical protein